MYSLGLWNIAQDHLDEAQKWLLEALQLSRQANVENHWEPTEYAGWLGLVYLLQGRYAEAEPLILESVDRASHIGFSLNIVYTHAS